MQTKAWNFLDSFRDGPLANASTLPQYMKQHGFYTAAFGKVMHPDLPPNGDYPLVCCACIRHSL